MVKNKIKHFWICHYSVYSLSANNKSRDKIIFIPSSYFLHIDYDDRLQPFYMSAFSIFFTYITWFKYHQLSRHFLIFSLVFTAPPTTVITSQSLKFKYFLFLMNPFLFIDKKSGTKSIQNSNSIDSYIGKKKNSV